MVLACVVCSIKCSFTPEVEELALCMAAFEPVEPHVVGFGSFGSHEAQCEAMCSGIVCCDWGGIGLLVSHFLQRSAQGHCLFAEQSTIVEIFIILVSEVKVACCSAFAALL